MPILANVQEELLQKLVPGSSPYWEAHIETIQALRSRLMHAWDLPEAEAQARVTGRVKDFQRILNKVSRIEKAKGQTLIIDTCKKLEEIVEDIAGARVVVNCLRDIYSVMEFIDGNDRWVVIPESRNELVRSASLIGYRAYHVTIITDTTDFEAVRCEIQIRTLLQHAWATHNRDLAYDAIVMGKMIKDIPENLLRMAVIQSNCLHNADEFAEIYREQFLEWSERSD